MRLGRGIVALVVFLLVVTAAVYATDDPPCNCQYGDDTSTTMCDTDQFCVIRDSWLRCGGWNPWGDNTCNGMRDLKSNHEAQ